MADFFEQLQRLTSPKVDYVNTQKTSFDNPDVYFMLTDKDDGVYLSVVDENKNPVSVDYRYYDSETAQLLHSIENIMRERRFQIVWDEVDQRINLYDHPYLCYQLVRCSHVIDSKGKEAICHGEKSELRLSLSRKDNMFVPQFRVGDTIAKKRFAMISDSFAWIDNDIYEIDSIGNNYRFLSIFQNEITKDALTMYLSVFYSYVDHVQVDIEGLDITLSNQEIVPEPTLYFEKVDTDKTLYLRVAEGIKNFDSEFIEKFNLTRAASYTSDNEVEIKRLRHRPVQQIADELFEEITKHMSK